MYSEEPAYRIYQGLFNALKHHFNDYTEAYDKLLEFLIVDFCPIALRAIPGNLSWLTENEKLYSDLVSTYNPDIIKSSMKDHLGALYCEIQGQRAAQSKGQFITPYNVCKMMAEMQMQGSQEQVTVLDPCCGTGSMLLAAHEANPNAIVFGVDIDLRAVRTCLINFAIHNIKGYVLHADALRHDTSLGTDAGRENWKYANRWDSHYNELKTTEFNAQAIGKSSEKFKQLVSEGQKSISEFI
jgi:type I restriction-modification system DNA methylase subunit